MIVAVLDVNVIISAVLGAPGFPRQVIDALRAGLVAATSAGIIAEVEGKLRLPRISRRYRLTDEDVSWAVNVPRPSPKSGGARHEVLAVTGDPEDDLVLATGAWPAPII